MSNSVLVFAAAGTVFMVLQHSVLLVFKFLENLALSTKNNMIPYHVHHYFVSVLV